MGLLLSSFVVLVVGAAVGRVCVTRLAAGQGAVERVVLGALAGLAGLVVASHLAAFAGSLAAAPVLVGVLVAFLAWRWPAVAPVVDRDTGSVWPLAAVVAISTAWFAVPVLGRSFPQGWDPAFHVALVESIRTLGRVPSTWAPWEPGEVFNYPSGLHALVAGWGRLSGVDSDRLFPVAFSAIAALAIGAAAALGTRAGGTRTAGAVAAAVYAFTSGWGTPSSHADWGGLPNLAGLALMGGFWLAVQDPGRRSGGLAALHAIAMAFAHHLSFALLAASVGLLVALEFLTERRLSPVGRTALGALAAAGVVVLVFVIARREGRFSFAQALRFDREHRVDGAALVRFVGLPMLLLGGAGLVWAIAKLRGEAERVLPVWALGLLGFWAAFDLVYRSAAWWLTGQDFTALTPSRGLTDAALPLSVCAGVMVARLPSWRGLVPIGVVAGLVAIGWGPERARLAADPGREREFARARALCGVVKARTEPDAVIFAPDAGAPGIWLPWLCARELNYFPDPGFFTSPYRDAKARAKDPQAFAAIVRASGPRPVYFATRRTWSGELVETVEGWRLYRVAP